MARNKHIRPTDVFSIVKIIQGWHEEKISWESVCDQSAMVLGYRPGRQGLSAHTAIKDAFQARKAGLKISPSPKAALPSSLAAAAQRLAAKDAEIQELNWRIDRLNQQFAVWLYNARGKLTIEQLNQPMPSIDRNHTSGKE